MLRSLTLAAAALVLAGPAAAHAQDPYPWSDRPHSTLSIGERDGTSVTALQAKTRRSGGRIVVDVTAAAFTRGGERVRAVLRVGRCLPGVSSFYPCPPAVSRAFTVTGRLRAIRLTAKVRVPRASVDAIRVSITRPGEVPRPRQRGAHAILELQGEGWRGPSARGRWGADIEPLDGVAVTDLRMDAVGISDGAVRPTIRWAVRTDHERSALWSYTGGPRRSVPLVPGGGSNGAFTRPLIRTRSRTIGMDADLTSMPLFRVVLPTPRR
jgi:hypothetical protein